MNEAVGSQMTDIPVEAVLSDELAHGDAVLGTIAPILGHLVISADNSLFSDEIVAQIRGMASSAARQLLEAQASADKADSAPEFIKEHAGGLEAELLAYPPFLTHCHALTVERQLTERLHIRSAVDPVLSPMIQALISSNDETASSNAMAILAAQSRFIQQQKRMELPLTELPGELFHSVIAVWRAFAAKEGGDSAAHAEMKLRGDYDEGAGRIGLLSRMVAGMGQGAVAALSVGHAGVALFLSALAAGSKQHREIAVLSTNDRQLGRLALGLRAGGLKPKEVEEQFSIIQPDITLPDGFEMLRRDRAAEMLASSGGQAGG